MGRRACTELQCLYKGDLYLYHRKREGVGVLTSALNAFSPCSK